MKKPPIALNDFPLTITYNGIIVEACLCDDGAMVVGESGTGKTFLFRSLWDLQKLNPSALRQCIEYRFPIDEVIFIDDSTRDPECQLFRRSNSLVIIDHADIVFQDPSRFADIPCGRDIENVAFILFGREWILPRFTFERYELKYIPGKEMFQFVPV